MHGAGGIRTHDLELMRLARTAAPLPRVVRFSAPNNRSGRQESNLRSPAPEAGGVATLPHDQTRKAPPAGFEPAASGLRARRHLPFDHGGVKAPAAGVEPAPHDEQSRVFPSRLHRNERRQQDSNLWPSLRERKGRESNRQGVKAHPLSRRGTAPMAGLPSERLRQESNLHHTDQESAALPVELRSRGVTGRDRTCGASRFRRALYR